MYEEHGLHRFLRLLLFHICQFLKRKEGIINTIAITNIVCVTDLVIKEELQSLQESKT